MNWYNFELQSIKNHQDIFPEKTVYHWSDIPEEELIYLKNIELSSNLNIYFM